ncbi:hypothetical protein H0H92_004276 [Tricholoma furcatifolium]|nr:hypothetical protein H0H92_004276 [Tricholoma furcatifolium]
MNNGDHDAYVIEVEVDNDEDQGRPVVATQTADNQGLQDAKGLWPALESETNVQLQQQVEESGALPACYVIEDLKIPGIVEDSGGCADVSRGIYQGEEVCVKENRCTKNTQNKVREKTLNEAVLCGNLSHPNIVPFLGVCFKGITPLLVYKWMKRGNIISYLKKYPRASRVHLLHGVALGVKHMHERSIVHGDIKGANILVDDSGKALIGDFGFASILPSSGGTVMYQAPEIFKQESYNTKETDIYAFGCLAYEIFVGKPPFANFAAPLVIMKVMDGQRPKRPSNSNPSWNAWGLTDHIWTLIVMCWDADPAKRPTIEMVIQRLEQVLHGGM